MWPTLLSACRKADHEPRAGGGRVPLDVAAGRAGQPPGQRQTETGPVMTVVRIRPAARLEDGRAGFCGHPGPSSVTASSTPAGVGANVRVTAVAA